MGAQKERPRPAFYRRTQSLDETTNECSGSPQQKRSFTLENTIPPSLDFHPSLSTEQKFRAELPRLTIEIPNPPELLSSIESASNSDDEPATNNGIRCMMAVEEQNAKEAKEDATAVQPSLKRNHSEVDNTTDDELNPPKAITLPDNIVKNPTDCNFNAQQSLPGTSKQFTQASHSNNPSNTLLQSASKKLKIENPSTSQQDEALCEKSMEILINFQKFFDSDPKNAQQLLDHLIKNYSFSMQAKTPMVMPSAPPPPSIDDWSVVTELIPKMYSEVTLLPTANVMVQNEENVQECRLLLDTGATANFIDKDLAIKLGGKIINSCTKFQTVGEIKLKTYGQMNLKLRSKYRRDGFGFFEEHAQFHIIDIIYGNYPPRLLNKNNFQDIRPEYYMADEFFYIDRKIDGILGNGITFPCLLNDGIRLKCGLTVKESKFGYTTGGTFNDRYVR